MSRCLLQNLHIFTDGALTRGDVFLDGGRFVSDFGCASPGDFAFDYDNCFLFPGFTDVHVHLREPGFSYKETIERGARAAARGGYTALCAMPNLNPAPDSPENLKIQLELIEKTAGIPVYPYGTITVGEKGGALSQMAALAPQVAAFSDDGRGVASEDLMRAAMTEAKRLGKLIAAHCEDESLLRGGCVHDGAYAKRHGLPGICAESEWRQLERDLKLVRETGCKYHMCHLSTLESLALIRRAKKEGLDVTCETAPHYLLLDDSMLQDDGRFKMNPPIRGKADREALLEGIQDGTIDMIATDHAPHSREEKSGGLRHSLNGIVGLETAFPVLYTGLVKTGVITLEKLVTLMSEAPAKRFGLPWGFETGKPANFTVFDLEAEYAIDPADFLSLGRSTPFEGWRVNGRCLLTVAGGRTVWKA